MGKAMQRETNQIGEPTTPIELRSVAIDDAGGLARREPEFPINFGFRWRNSEFQAVVRKVKGTLNLELSTGLGRLPFTAEDAHGRGRLLSVITGEADERPGTLKVVRDSTVTLSKDVSLPSSGSLTAHGLVANLAVAVLTLAPYLDLLAEHRTA